MNNFWLWLILWTLLWTALGITMSRISWGKRGHPEKSTNNGSMNKRPLYVYIIGVAVVWLAILCAAWFLAGGVHFSGALALCFMFGLGMLAMYIAVHIYRWK
jgi:hypothetical protein